MIHNITVEELQDWISSGQKLQLVDVRTPQEHEFLGYIEGVHLIPLDELQARLKELDPTKKTVMICQKGIRSAEACYYLQQVKGFRDIYNLEEGMSGWTGPLHLGSNNDSTTHVLNNT